MGPAPTLLLRKDERGVNLACVPTVPGGINLDASKRTAVIARILRELAGIEFRTKARKMNGVGSRQPARKEKERRVGLA